MAERRMFSVRVVETDSFLDMPLSTQALYFHLGLNADDDGFLANPRMVQRMIGCAEDDLKLLLTKGFVLSVGNGVCVIRDWKLNNYIRKDRYTESKFLAEKQLLEEDKNGSYRFRLTDGIPDGNQEGDSRSTQNRIVKINKDSCPSDDGRKQKNDQKKERLDAEKENFRLIYAAYPRKEGKAGAFKAYLAYVGKGKKINGETYRLTNDQLWNAVNKFAEECRRKGTETEYIPLASTFFNGRILDYLPEEGGGAGNGN